MKHYSITPNPKVDKNNVFYFTFATEDSDSQIKYTHENSYASGYNASEVREFKKSAVISIGGDLYRIKAYVGETSVPFEMIVHHKIREYDCTSPMGHAIVSENGDSTVVFSLIKPNYKE